MSSYTRGFYLFIVIAILILWCLPLGSGRPLARPDEARYAEISREMAISQDFVTPRLNGIRYFEKPPLQYWVTALAFRTFGVHEWTARLYTTLAGLMTVILVGALAHRMRSSGVEAFAIAAGTFYVALLGHINTLDSGLTAMMTAALWAFLNAKSSQNARAWMGLAGGFTGLALLSKGLIALVLPGLALVLYTLLHRNFSAFKRIHLPIFLSTLLVVAAPWFILCSLKNPEFAHFFFIHEHFERYTSAVHQRVEPLWYFLPVYLLGLLPWTALLPPALAAAWRDPLHHAGFKPKRFLALYGLSVLLFFSLSGSKLPTYVFPAYPAIVVLIALHVDSKAPRLVPSLTAFLFGASMLFAAALFRVPGLSVWFDIPLDLDPDMVDPYRAFALWIGLAGVSLVVGALIALKRRRFAPSALSISALFAATLGLYGATALAQFNSIAPWIMSWRNAVADSARVYSIGTYDQSLPFYLGHTVTLVAFEDELGPGLKAEPALGIPSLEAFAKIWGQKPDDIAIMEPQMLRTLDEQHLKYRVLAQDPRHVVVSAQ